MPGTAAISADTSRRVPPSQVGWARMAAATRASAVSAGAVAMREKARARPVRVSANSGAPHPSTPTAAICSPATSATVSCSTFCSGWSALGVGLDRPVVRHTGGEHGRVLARAVHRDRARWPGRPGRRRPSPGRRPDSRAASAGPTRRDRRSARMRRTPSMWNASPEWLAHASASSSPSRSAPPATCRPPGWACSTSAGRPDDRGRRSARARCRRRRGRRPNPGGSPRRSRCGRPRRGVRTGDVCVCGTPRP